MVSKLKISMAIVAICMSTLFAEKFSGKQGDIWTGGSFNYLSMGGSGGSDRMNIVTLDPMIRFFPVSGLCLGPRITWMGEFSGDYSLNNFGLGMDIGYAGGSQAIPYFISSPHFVFISSNASSTSTQAFFLPFTAGMIIPAGSSLGIQLELGYSIGFNMGSGSGETANAFTIGIGVCGLGEKLAVSIVNTLNLMTSAF
jgi:hypothetical protein